MERRAATLALEVQKSGWWRASAADAVLTGATPTRQALDDSQSPPSTGAGAIPGVISESAPHRLVFQDVPHPLAPHPFVGRRVVHDVAGPGTIIAAVADARGEEVHFSVEYDDKDRDTVAMDSVLPMIVSAQNSLGTNGSFNMYPRPGHSGSRAFYYGA